jgi:hypothetical protein
MNARQYFLMTQQQNTEILLESLETQGFSIFMQNAQRTDEESLVDEEAIEVPWTITSED